MTDSAGVTNSRTPVVAWARAITSTGGACDGTRPSRAWTAAGLPISVVTAHLSRNVTTSRYLRIATSKVCATASRLYEKFRSDVANNRGAKTIIEVLRLQPHLAFYADTDSPRDRR